MLGVKHAHSLVVIHCHFSCYFLQSPCSELQSANCASTSVNTGRV
uniref:Uncharacterized protein n=1 Tax=Rhizophora mucronata TaxID=61149 RepID=A0A2P2IY49_RHIMU